MDNGAGRKQDTHMHVQHLHLVSPPLPPMPALELLEVEECVTDLVEIARQTAEAHAKDVDAAAAKLRNKMQALRDRVTKSGRIEIRRSRP